MQTVREGTFDVYMEGANIVWENAGSSKVSSRATPQRLRCLVCGAQVAVSRRQEPDCCELPLLSEVQAEGTGARALVSA